VANNGTEWIPPQWGTTDVLYGTGVAWTASVGTSVPSDVNLGDSTQWVAAGWSYIGATDQGVSITFTPRMTDIMVEEQPIPVAEIVDTATFTIDFSMAEETLANINIAYGAGGAISTVAQATGQPGKSVLTLSSNFRQLAVALLGRNQNGWPRIFLVPVVMSTGTVKTDFRRAANKRMYPVTLSSIVNLNQCTITDITSPAL
jgi:hypothetical protein